MIVDTSALVAILYREPEAQAFVERIRDADVCQISVATTVELSMVVSRPARAEAFLRGAGVVVEPVTLEHGELARQAFPDFGMGRHKAGLNFGDCFSYALAKATGEALLYKGGDFALTDIRSGRARSRRSCAPRLGRPSIAT
jgi:ribonuclease VapC